MWNKRGGSLAGWRLLARNNNFIPKKLLWDAIAVAFQGQTGDLVVDVGCGYQPYRPLTAGYRRYVGVDLEARRRPQLAASAENLPLTSGACDAVLCTEVIEHTPEPAAVVTEVARILKPGGRLILTAPMSWGLHYEPHDYYRFTPYSLRRLAQQAGLRVVSVQRLGGLLALIGARLSEVLFGGLYRAIPVRGLRRAAAWGCVLPLNLVFYSLSRLLDRLDQHDAIGWLVVAVKEGAHAA